MTGWQKVKTGFGTILFVLLIGLYFHIRGCYSKHSPTPALKATDQIVFSYDDDTHVLTTITHTAAPVKQYAENPVVHVSKDGTVQVQAHAVGFQFQPFIGFSYGDGPRLNLGLTLFHFWRLDLNGQMAFTLDDSKALRTVVPVVSVSYNVFHNTSLFVGVAPLDIVLNQKPALHGGVLLKF